MLDRFYFGNFCLNNSTVMAMHQLRYCTWLGRGHVSTVLKIMKANDDGNVDDNDDGDKDGDYDDGDCHDMHLTHTPC